MGSAVVTKDQLRNSFRIRRSQVQGRERELAEREIQERVNKLLKNFLDLDQYVAGYRATQDEVNIDDFLFSAPYRFYFPKVENDAMQFYPAQSEYEFSLGKFGILEPVTSDSQDVSEMKAILVPGVAFDRRGTRLGFGKGYYDKYLSKFDGLKIGVGFAGQLSDDPIPSESHDVYMDFIVTENFILRPIMQKRT